ncbi:PAS domain-containing protein [Methylobacterium soli]|uniref:histidine kinase n=1 Tax=Methylobacterium soli TaxID=553447 RepID=A0A6L3T2W9_9HYPH|nr:PAS domain-containing protein [Methylobacterium soli]KAB1081167.1 PAS domain-containing protein [Methylobacterium soli]GJE43915.1 hypothetical protein AEGHOMDF_3095 [Methylobacterium soli]
MNAAGPPFSSHAFLRLIEDYGLTGHWNWAFEANIQTWSLGFYRLLGLEPGSVRPSYDLFRDRVHPDDLAMVETVSEIRVDGLLRDHAIRVIRPDGSIRILATRGEIYVTPEGRPLAAAGTVLDITEPERLERAQALERQRRLALFAAVRSFEFSSSVDGRFNHPQELFSLTGLPADEIADNPYVAIVAQEREHWRSHCLAARSAGSVHITTPLVPLMAGGQGRFMVVTVPVLDAQGRIAEWSSLAQPLAVGSLAVSGALRAGLEQAVRGHHLRAGRALLDWSMLDMARASGLSLSTIRRLEANVEAAAARSRHVAIAALRASGIGFRLMDHNRIAVLCRPT